MVQLSCLICLCFDTSLITLGVHVQQGGMVVGMSVNLSVTLHLTCTDNNLWPFSIFIIGLHGYSLCNLHLLGRNLE